MNVRVITSLRQFDALAPAWEALTAESGQRSPFLSHDWFACCWRTAGRNHKREVWVLEDDAAPVAFLPLVRWKGRHAGFPARMMGFLESPDTPFTDVPFVGSCEAVVGAFAEALQGRPGWDVLRLNKLPSGSQTLQALERLLPGRFLWRVVSRGRSPYVTIAGDWKNFLAQKSHRFRKTCRNIENRISRSGQVTVEEHRSVDPDAPVFGEVIEVSRQSWKGPRGLSMATMSGMPRFFRELTQRASANGWLHLWVLRLDGRAVATEYQIRSDGRLHALRADFDSMLANLSPGAALNQRIIETLFERTDVAEYDMGPGGNPYKLRWATGEHESVSIQVYAPTSYGRLLHAVDTRLIPLVRRWRARLRAACA
jgi:CelD/BcsL family acetyltransferase involved in cellulose biosynthesis